MPMLELHSAMPCGLCGRRLAGFTIGTYRVNKATLVMFGKSPGIGWHESTCRECGHVNGVAPKERYRLAPKSLALVNAVRVKRGWKPWPA